MIQHGQFIMGPEVFELEEQLASYTNVKHCITCANGTDALQIALMAAGVGIGDIVITTSFSFFATAEVIPLVGATPYFCDINADTYNLCTKSLEAAICNSLKLKGKLKAVIVPDMFGMPADYKNIKSLCEQHNLILIEDAAQSFGASIDGKKCGSFGDISTTSFFPAKPLGCFGDGGAIFTDNDVFAQICRSIRIHGQGSNKYDNIRVGLNSRLDTIQAAVLLEKLTIFDDELKMRENIARRYIDTLKDKYVVPSISDDSISSAWAQFSIRAKNEPREKIRKILQQSSVGSAIYYPTPLNRTKPMEHYPSEKTPNADKVCDEVISIPMYPFLTKEQQNKVIATLIE